MKRSNEWFLIGAVVLFVVGLLAFQFAPSGDDAPAGAVRVEQADISSGSDTAEFDDTTVQAGDDTSSYETEVVYDWIIDVDELPDEAFDTLYLIDDGGPYPYSKDGSTFQNREGLLPDHPQGYYREFTVDTPGSSDRGARRIVAGDGGEFYWTADHYDSFAQIVGW